MTNTPTEFEAYCRDNPTDPKGSPTNLLGKDPSWDQKCGSLVYRAGAFPATAISAYQAAVRTRELHGLNTKLPLNKIPRGWIVYFDKGGPLNGHVGMVTRPGVFLSANWRVSNYGTALGEMTIQAYIDTGATYMGASPYYIDATLDLTASAGGNPIPVPEMKESPEMFRAALVNTTRVAYFDSISFFETTDGSVDDNAWGRFVGKPGLTVTQAEWDSYKRVAAANLAKVVVPPANAPSVAQIRAGLAPDFDAIPAAVIAEQKKPGN